MASKADAEITMPGTISDARQEGEPGLCADASGARAAHPPVKSHFQRTRRYQPDVPRLHGVGGAGRPAPG